MSAVCPPLPVYAMPLLEGEELVEYPMPRKSGRSLLTCLSDWPPWYSRPATATTVTRTTRNDRKDSWRDLNGGETEARQRLAYVSPEDGKNDLNLNPQLW